MHIRNYTILILFLLFAATLSAQDFITLDWRKIVTDGEKQSSVPSFAGAAYYENSQLPCYVQNISLGRDYSLYKYDVKVEYPEYQALEKSEVEALNRLNEKLEIAPVVTTSLGISAKKGILEVRFVPLVFRDGRYMRIKSFKLTLNKVANPYRIAGEHPQRYTEKSVLASGKWVKIQVSGSGIYQITNNELSGMGFSNPAKVRLYGYGGRILPEVLSDPVVDDLREVPFWRENGYVLFYANGTVTWTKSGNTYKHRQNYYATHGYYFLTESDVEPMSFPRQNSLAENGATTITTFPDYALYERDAFSWMAAGKQFFDDYDYKLQNTKSYILNAPGIVSADATVTVSFSAAHSASTTADAEVNGTNLGSMSFSGLGQYDVASVVEKDFVWKKEKNEKTTVKITHNRPSTASGRLDFIRLNYLRNLSFTGSSLCFRSGAKGKMKFVLSGANENVHIWDISNVNNYHEVNGTLAGDKYTVVGNSEESSEFVAVNVKGSFNKVEVVGNVSNQNLHSLKGVNMVIITPPNIAFIREAERLAEAHRKKDNLTVQVITSEQIYNEFSSGTPDATAYRWLMKMLYDRSATEKDQPKYLLLFGDGAWDNRMVTSSWRTFNPKDFLLCYESDNSVSHTYSYVLEDYFGYLDDGEGGNKLTDKVDVGVGRFPVRTVEQARQMVDKTLDYMYNVEAGSWKNITCFLGDDGDSNKHMGNADAIAKVVENNYENFLVKKIYWDSYKRETSASGNSYPEAKKDILDQLKTGALIVAYSGHANPEGLSHEWVLRSADMKKLTSPRLPLWLTMGCDVGPFDSAEESFGEVTFLNPKGGAIAILTSTRTTYPDPNEALARAFVKSALAKDENGKQLTLGDAIREAKCALINNLTNSSNGPKDGSVNKLQYVLLGDPALALSAPQSQVVLDEFNGKAPSEAETTIKAGGKVTVKGRVLNDSGATAEDFLGTVHFTLKDRKQKIETRVNDVAETKVPFVYYDRPVTLSAGSDSIRSGKFTFTFPVPMDISYSFESGLLNLYAINSSKEREGQGMFTNFLVGGTEDGAMTTDSLGPKINMYLNTPDFPYGGETNETPMLVVNLEDEDGINAVGNGIGHDLMAVIDGSPAYSYILNNYYTSAFGDYTKGSVRYSLPELPDGKHKLLLRAWDVKNNSSTSELEFTVKRGLRPGLFDIDCISPARTGTTFILTHNRPESELEVNVAVYDFSGREMWVHTEKGTSSNSTYYIDWNLTSNGGQRMQPGVYLFRASITSGGSKESTKARKIVILAQ